MINDAHGDDLENGEEDCRRCHGGWELQHGRDIGSYLGRSDHPVKRIVARAPSDGLESHEKHQSTEVGRQGAVQYILFHSQKRRASPNQNLRAVKVGFIVLCIYMRNRPHKIPVSDYHSRYQNSKLICPPCPVMSDEEDIASHSFETKACHSNTLYTHNKATASTVRR